MDSYVVRIYRRDRDNPHNLVGLVEIVADQEERPFGNFEELQNILCNAGKISHAKQKTLCRDKNTVKQ